MLREWHPGQRVTSIAVQSLGVGTILVPSISHVIVEWDDGSWSKERYQDIIYVGESKLEPLPIPTKGGNPIPRRGSNDSTLDGSRKLDFDPQEDFDDDTIPNQKFIIPTGNIDTETIKVSVKENANSSTKEVFEKVSNILDVSATAGFTFRIPRFPDLGFREDDFSAMRQMCFFCF